MVQFECCGLGEWYDKCGMAKNMYEMDEQELGLFISQQEQKVAKLDYEKPGSPA